MNHMNNSISIIHTPNLDDYKMIMLDDKLMPTKLKCRSWDSEYKQKLEHVVIMRWLLLSLDWDLFVQRYYYAFTQMQLMEECIHSAVPISAIEKNK